MEQVRSGEAVPPARRHLGGNPGQRYAIIVIDLPLRLRLPREMAGRRIVVLPRQWYPRRPSYRRPLHRADPCPRAATLRGSLLSLFAPSLGQTML